MEKKKLFIDMDGVLASFKGAIDSGKTEDQIGFYENLEPIPEAIETVKKLGEKYDMFILSTPSWSKPHCWSEKRLWVAKHFGDLFRKKVILAHRKDLIRGDILIDDHTWNGAKDFQGEFIHFGTEKYPDWKAVADHLLAEEDEPANKGKGLGALFPQEDIDTAEHSMNDSRKKGGSIQEELNNKPENTMTKTSDKPYEQVLKELKENIANQLDFCESTQTPAVCRMIASPEGYKKLEDMIIDHVADGGLTISKAIITVERSFNPNMIQD